MRRIIAEKYVLPERRAALDAALAEGSSAGRYDVRDPAILAERVNADLERVGRDYHLNFRYDPRQAAMMAARTESRPDPSAMERQIRRGNHGVRELRLLPGNVRYLNLTAFDWIGEESESALNIALEFLKGGDAVIIDLRRNGGGHPRAVHQIISHFMEPGRPLISFQQGNETSPVRTSLPGLGGMIGKPLYVLTSGDTGSAAEEFAGHVAGYRLGEIVGATTSGGAFMNELVPIAGSFVLSVSVGRPVLAATGRDWEGVGIAPTMAVPVESALEAAHVHALRRLAGGGDANRRAELEALAAGLEAVARPGTPGAPLSAYAGAYGERQLFARDGKLWYRLGRRVPRPLVPLGGHQFTLNDDPLMRLVFHPAGDRITAFDLGPATGPVLGRYERTQ